MSATTMGRRQDVGDGAGQTEPVTKKRKVGVSLGYDNENWDVNKC